MAALPGGNLKNRFVFLSARGPKHLLQLGGGKQKNLLFVRWMAQLLSKQVLLTKTGYPIARPELSRRVSRCWRHGIRHPTPTTTRVPHVTRLWRHGRPQSF